jgi:hypothetical protein
MHLSLQLPLGPEHQLVAHGLVLVGVGAEFGAIQRHISRVHQTCFLADLEHLEKQANQGIEVTAAEAADAAMVVLLIARQHLECCVLRSGLPGFARELGSPMQ